MVRSGATYDRPGWPGGGTCASTCTSKRLRAAAGAASAPNARTVRRTARSLKLDLCQDLGGGALARAHRAVHVAVPVRRRLGAGPVDRADRGAYRRAEVEQGARSEHRDRAAPRPLLGRPVLEHEVARALGLVAEVVGEALEGGIPLLVRIHAEQLA